MKRVETQKLPYTSSAELGAVLRLLVERQVEVDSEGGR
jgi:hypothetical protein